ncbi:hypothetical protein NQ317_017098 [Molorchus minor]|uniref:Uncharacterized protein n=1 Tax=Molorchus minor TaxID=1323400 RepID=A0ABQ9IW30_9CUCU|nr:hypothetical protein NQ317_017098 [Molorchus minor]
MEISVGMGSYHLGRKLLMFLPIKNPCSPGTFREKAQSIRYPPYTKVKLNLVKKMYKTVHQAELDESIEGHLKKG